MMKLRQERLVERRVTYTLEHEGKFDIVHNVWRSAEPRAVSFASRGRRGGTRGRAARCLRQHWARQPHKLLRTGGGIGIHWEAVDENISVASLLCFSIWLCVAGLVFVSLQSPLAWASAPLPQQWGIGCYDNNCIWITDSKLTSEQKFLVSTFAPGASRAAEAAGEKPKAASYYAALLKSTGNGENSTRPELAHARSFVSSTERASN